MRQIIKKEDSNFLNQIVCNMLQINDQFYCYEPFKIFIFIVSMCQPVFYLYYYDYDQFQEKIPNTTIQQMIFYFFRPEILLFKFFPNIVILIIPYIILVIIFIAKLGIIFNLANENQRYSNKQKNPSILKNMFITFTSYYQQLLCIILHYPIQTLLICSISNTLKQFQNQNSAYFALLLFGIIIFFIIEIETLLNLFICFPSSNFHIKGFEKSIVTSFDIIIYAIELLQIILFGTIIKQEISQFAQIVLTLIIALLKIINQLMYQGYIYKTQRIILYFINSMIISYSCYAFINLKNNSIIIWPLLASIILYIDYQYQINSIYSIFINTKQPITMYVYQLIKFSNNCYQNEIQPFQNSLIWSQHKAKCSNVTCSCKDQTFNILDVKQANIITEQIFKQFIYTKIKHITKQIHENRNIHNLDTAFYEIAQATLFMRQGFVLIAIKNYNRFLNNSSNDYRVRVISSEKSLTNRPQKKIKQSQVDSQIQDIINNQHKKVLKYDVINRNFQVSTLKLIKIQYLLKQAQVYLNENFTNSICTAQQLQMSEYLNFYLKSEFQMDDLVQMIIKIIKLKIEFYTYLLKCDAMNADKIFIYKMKYFTQVLDLEEKLLQKYEAYQSIKMKQMIIFFYSRIYNSYQKAQKFKQINNNQQQKYIFSNQVIDFYSDKIMYVLFQLQDDLQNLRIKSHSSNFLKIIGRQPNEHLIQFNDILPEFIREEHPAMVQRFVQTGKARYYRNLSLTFVKQQNGLSKQMEQTFDTVTLLNDNRVVFASIIQDVLEQKAYLLVNVNGLLSGMTFMCLRKLGFSEEDILNIDEFYSFYEVEINQIIPVFNNIPWSELQEQKLDNVKFLFVDILQFQRENYSKSSIENHSQLGRVWQDSRYTKEYAANLFIMKREIFGFYYFIIELESAHLIESSHQNNAVFSCTQFKQTQHNAESAIFDIDSIILSIDEGAAKHVNTLNIQERENYSIALKELSKQQDFDKIYQVMLSPNNSVSNLIDKSQNMINTVQRHNSSFQQEYYCQQPAFFNAEASSKEKHPQLQQVQKQDDLQQQQSESSLGSIKRPIYMKKFEIIDSFYSNFNFSQQQIMVFFIIFTLIVFGIFSVIILSLLSNDLQTKIQEIEMLSFQADIVAPYDRYLAIRAQIYYYQGLYTAKKISQQQTSDLVEPLYSIIGVCYNELKQNSYISLLESDLKEFFKDVYTNTFFMGMTDKIIYSKNITFREFIHQLLNYQYDFKIIFDKRIPTKGCPCQVFQFSNYFNLQDNLELMSQEILQFSRDKCTQIIDKWITIWIVFIVVCFVLSLLIYYLKTGILFQYDTIMEIITHITEQSILKETEKHKILLNNLSSQTDYINSYQLELQTEIQQNIQNKGENDVLRKNKRKILIRASKFRSIIFSFVIFVIFLIYSCLITFQTQSFLNKYQSTADFYKLIADLSFRSGNMFLYREMFMLWGNLTYLNKTDGLRLYNLIDIAQSKIMEYVDQAPRINLETLLVPENFYEFFLTVQNTDVCNFLDENYRKVLTPYCQKSFDSSLMKGMLPALTYIHQTIITQQAINNFTYRAEDILYEVEGGQVASRVFSFMNKNLQKGIINKTESFNYQNQLLSIFFLIALGIICFYVINFHYTNLKQHLQLIKFGVLMIPQSDILKNDFFERYLKQIELKLGYKL
ncbi:unnamed protein product [Paramecium primaurelia]|uniref:PAS domain-containing protein n=1 Tax=Paramecium primaurelia TaxID=5886 RepID=A0A8S1M964_PARPR|nr:unnamed protein product [Paramecium primaurelia]